MSRDAGGPTIEGMPALGLGTWQNDDPEQCAETVETALELGYRHVDTAQLYRNEAAVGRGIANSRVDRQDVFLATKVWIDRLDPAGVAESTRDSLERLDTGYVDLLYVHWPAGAYDPEETLPAFAELIDDGLVERIGVSNFEPAHLDRAAEVLGEAPFANQVECHPLLQQPELRAYHDDHDSVMIAYSPLARGRVFDLPAVAAAAEKHGVSEAQVSLAWLREKGIAAVPKATGEAHLRDNWRSLNLSLDDGDVAAIDAIDRSKRLLHPEQAPDSW